MLELFFIIACTLFFEAVPVEAAEFCQYGYTTSYYGFGTYLSKYCDYGCCGDKYSTYSDVCCVQNVAGIIAGAVIGSLVGLAILIGLIVFCCVAANSSKRRTGVVIQPPNPNIQTCVVSSTTVTQGSSTNPPPYGPVGYGYTSGFQPPAYSQYNNVPQGGNGLAYPPPPAANY